jgi:hypothetical protein
MTPDPLSDLSHLLVQPFVVHLAYQKAEKSKTAQKQGCLLFQSATFPAWLLQNKPVM